MEIFYLIKTNTILWTPSLCPSSSLLCEGEKIHRNWKNNGAVLLRGDAVQSLKVAELQGAWTLSDHLTGRSQSSTGLLLTLCCYYLENNFIFSQTKKQIHIFTNKINKIAFFTHKKSFTFALASLAASASAAMALWSWTGSLTSLL